MIGLHSYSHLGVILSPKGTFDNVQKHFLVIRTWGCYGHLVSRGQLEMLLNILKCVGQPSPHHLAQNVNSAEDEKPVLHCMMVTDHVVHSSAQMIHSHGSKSAKARGAAEAQPAEVSTWKITYPVMTISLRLASLSGMFQPWENVLKKSCTFSPHERGVNT